MALDLGILEYRLHDTPHLDNWHLRVYGGLGLAAWVLSGVGLALAAGGGVILGVGQMQRADVESAMAGTLSWSEARSQGEAADLMTILGIVGLGTGGALAGAGLIWAMTSGSVSESETAIQLRVLPTGLRVEGTF